MFKEAVPLNIRSYRTFPSLLCAAAILPAVGIAQEPEGPIITVMTFQANEQGLGAKAADELRSHLTDAFSSKDLYTVPTADIQTNLESSGFSIDDPLGSVEERQLANMVRADMYITGKITHGMNDRYRFEPRFILPHDITEIQPLPIIEKKELGDVMDDATRSIREAIKQLEGTKRCEGLMRQKPLDAAAAARAAIKAYPRATLARFCMERAYLVHLQSTKTAADSAATEDSILAVSQGILQLDSMNVPALRYSAAFYKLRGDSARERQALFTLIHADTANVGTSRDVIFQLAGENRINDALPLLKDMLSKNPGDTSALRLAFLVYSTAKDWQSVADVGSSLAKVDTTVMDSTYFSRMAIAYDQLKQPQAATDILTQATAKYPHNAYFWFYYAKELQQSNQSKEAIAAYQRYISLQPKDQSLLVAAYLSLGTLYDTTNAFDSLYTLVNRAALLPGLDTAGKSNISLLALHYGNKLLQAVGTPAPPPQSAQQRNDLQNSIKFLQLSNQIWPSANAQFLMGTANFLIMQSATQEAGDVKSCSLSRLAQQTLDSARTQLPTGLTRPELQASAQNMLGYLPKFTPAIQQYVKKFCK